MNLDPDFRFRMGVALATVPGGALSYATAGFIHGLLVHEPASVHISVPHGGHRPARQGITIHQSLDSAVCSIEALMVTTLARTAVNVASTIRHPYDSRGLIYRAVFERGLDPTELLRHALMAPKNGRGPVVRAAREIAAGARSVPEGVLWTAATELGLPLPELNGAVHTAAGIKFVDGLYRDRGLGIEIDGKEHHTSPEDVRKDGVRQQRLEESGLLIVRFTAAEVLYDTARVMTEVMALLKTPKPVAAWQRRHDASLTFDRS
jgi:very-short-patch-repair endonuclease